MSDGDWVEVSLKIIQKSLNDPERLEYWVQNIRPIAAKRFNKWAETKESVPLFREMSKLVMRLLLYIFTGDEFAGKHADELVPLIQNYETVLQKPVTKILPRWMSFDGRFMNKVEKRLTELIDEEVDRRLENPKKYEQNKDYLQYILNTVGGKFKFGKLLLNVFLRSVPNSYSYSY